MSTVADAVDRIIQDYEVDVVTDVIAAAFHLQGRHDQATHGRGGRSGDAALKAAPVSITQVVNYAPQAHEQHISTHPETGITSLPEDVGVSRDEYDALNDMRNYRYVPVNDVLHGRSTHSPTPGMEGEPTPKITAAQRKKAEENTKTIDKVMKRSKLTNDVTVYRETRSARWLPRGDNLTGAEWTDAGFAMTSANYDLHYSEPSAVRLSIHVPKGTGAVAMDRQQQSMLLNRGLRYRVRADHGVIDGVRHLDVDVIT